MKQNRFVTLAQPVQEGQLLASHFSLRDRDIPSIGDGQLLLRPIVFSVDPAMRGEITGWDMVGGAHHQPGDPITGPGVGEVVQSRRPGYSAGDVVRATMDWADYSVWRPDGDWYGVTKVDPACGRPSNALGVYGINGLTAYYGMVEVGKPQPGETVLVSSAAGSVGSMAGQIAKILGARVIGLTSTREKQDVLTGRLGFDAALDYRADDLADQLHELIPGGADVYFDNVGGHLSQVVMNQMRRPARVVECGQISTYEGDAWKVDISPIHLYGLRFEGFNPLLFADQDAQALAQLVEWVQTSKLIALETEHTGLAVLPVALEGIFRGSNVGKMIVTL
jgi:NADPH-dependent curcumin reductase CurA